VNIIKFGGSSISNSKNIQKVINIVKDYDGQTIVVLSAFGKTTDNILYCGKLASEKNKDYLLEFKKIESFHYDIIRSSVDINFQVKILTKVQQILLDLESILNGIFGVGELSDGIEKKISTFGEILSSTIFYQITKYHNLKSDYFDSRKIIFIKKSTTNNIIVDFEKTNKKLNEKLKNSSAEFIIMPGFIASDSENNVTTLGRGGSDFTASIICSLLSVKKLDIWTDVSGMYTANPKIVKQAKPIQKISEK
jgi:aspartokinase/homoserine dehydrogenase 1